MKLVVDRIEEEYVVCENQETSEIIILDKFCFPSNIKDGDTVEFLNEVATIVSNEEKRKNLFS